MKIVFTENEKNLIEKIYDDGIKWIEQNQYSDADAINGKQKEIDAKHNPIMMREHQKAEVPGASEMPVKFPKERFPRGRRLVAGEGAHDAKVEVLDKWLS